MPFQQFAELGCESKGHGVNCITSFIYLVDCFWEKHGFRKEGCFVLRCNPSLINIKILLRLTRDKNGWILLPTNLIQRKSLKVEFLKDFLPCNLFDSKRKVLFFPI